ncbi:TonB-dependent receptor; Outer membrane receptor for ferrienterochelin and colicins [Olavius algarvensis associated proteobacterium Delta 3]|nr:TonB-dependent receptor; Outer membrane receptor for ferrienterochelin and colicins [Olavius algarvensis associated proteobacterium Delta 3]CAB5164496.1 TonB-dependent receptor; Outer membrane receptor for ferrienterochelin and colicins [Olavius algarvensis associated proteobacterium Delta 3]
MRHRSDFIQLREVAIITEHFFLSLLIPWLMICFFFKPHMVFAQDEQPPANTEARFEMEEVVVTATGLEDEIRNIPKNVTVITAEDIEQSSSNNVVDLLSREANVNLQSLFGHDSSAAVDIRGQGSAAATNVLVLVDGFRLNPPDLSRPDFSAVPLGQIERIEIIRGANSVLYGNGAVGGVVNIITKDAPERTAGILTGSHGSFDTYNARASVGGRTERLGYTINGGYYDTDGYRENGFYRRSDVSGRVGYDVGAASRISLTTTFTSDAQGFPGGVPLEATDNRDLRRQTRSPNDEGEGQDLRLLASGLSDLNAVGELTVNLGYRNRRSDFILGFTPLKTIDEQQSHIFEETASFDVFDRKDFLIGDREQTLRVGFNWYYSDYVTERPDQLTRKNSRLQSLAVFALGQGAVTERLTYNIGGRLSTYKGKFRTDDLVDFGGGEQRWVNGDPFDRNWNNSAVDAGLVYMLNQNLRLFTGYATSYRIPTVDELALAVDDLVPQEGQHMDLGIRATLSEKVETALTVFYVVTENEIFFDSINNINSNFEEDTRRQGIELDVRTYPWPNVYLWGNYTFMDARFTGSETVVPLVPEHSASIGVEWRIIEPLLLAVTGSYVGEKFDGNDFSNSEFAKIDPYTVFDAKVTYSWRKFRFFGGINNIFDTLYETVAFSESYFTMPTRNFYGGLEWNF